MEGILFIVFTLLVYFLPAVVAAFRKHKNTSAVVVLNLFLGWTMIGWVVAMIWAFTNNTEKTPT